jgi:hypothetical protein
MELPSGSERMKYRGSLEVCENPLCRCMGLTLHLTLDKELSGMGESATIVVLFDLRDKLNSSSTFELPMETFRRETGKVGRNDPCFSLAIKLPCS